MYNRILITLDRSAADEVILRHVEALQQHFQSELVLLHVADGWVARHYNELKLKESEEMREDRAYLEAVAGRLRGQGMKVELHLAMGDPADEIIRFVKEQNCDLIAMSTHGHRFLSDLIHGATVTKVRHQVDIPVLLLKAPRK